jgi:ferredoxin, 2Fe-2S
MPRVIVVEVDGTEHILLAMNGRSIMQAARDRLAPYLIGECGGSCICASCHAYVDSKWLGVLPPVSPNEASMLDAIENVRYNSRLMCQVLVREELDGIIVRIPPG